ncbi:MAG: (2Fe-2S)-binding protein [Ignavibacteria bacterium GWB2_35_6b]|nr:MAG: (2Fe-2S)-binding protein [Ignavibacteria bacterium GWB2_35_6b]
MPPFLIEVNGKKRTVDVDNDTPLLWVLRDNLGLTGTKYSCGEGYCGSCTVHINGQAERSCSVTIEDAAGSTITTIEGLAEDKNNPIFKTWIHLEVSQCGYCQPGQIMTLAALLKENPKPTKKEISDTMTGVLCRCGTYHRIKKAAEKIAEGEQL